MNFKFLSFQVDIFRLLSLIPQNYKSQVPVLILRSFVLKSVTCTLIFKMTSTISLNIIYLSVCYRMVTKEDGLKNEHRKVFLFDQSKNLQINEPEQISLNVKG